MEDEYLRTKILIPEEEKKLTALLVELEINSSVKSDLMRKLRQKIFSKLTEGMKETPVLSCSNHSEFSFS